MRKSFRYWKKGLLSQYFCKRNNGSKVFFYMADKLKNVVGFWYEVLKVLFLCICNDGISLNKLINHYLFGYSFNNRLYCTLKVNTKNEIKVWGDELFVKIKVTILSNTTYDL